MHRWCTTALRDSTARSVCLSSNLFSPSLPMRNAGSLSATTAVTASGTTDGVLEAALRDVLCCPRAPLPQRHVYLRLTNPHRLVREFHHAKRTRRLHAQRVALTFLRRHNVLMHGLLFYAPRTGTWNHTAEFSRLALVGEAYLQSEMQVRTLKLIPRAPTTAFTTLTHKARALESVCAHFDDLRMGDLADSPLAIPGVAASPHSRRARRGAPVLSAQMKYHMLCAIVAEMYWFAQRTRGADRTTNNALFPPSDVLILNVLCTHLLETIPAELIYSQLIAPINNIHETWVNKTMSLPSQLSLKPRTVGAHALSSAPRSTPSTETQRSSNSTSRVPVPVRALSAEPQVGHVQSVMHPILDWSRVATTLTCTRRPSPHLALSQEKVPCSLLQRSVDVSATRRREMYMPVAQAKETV